MSFDKVEEFEEKIAQYFGAPFAIATDSCTHAIELCLRYKKIKNASCPKHTYLSVPMTFEKLGLDWAFTDTKWEEYYTIGGTNIIDSAVLWRKNSYVKNTLMCISFQYKKHLGLGRGGIILCDNVLDRTELIKLSYDGRHRKLPWAEQQVFQIGYHYYMTPEVAQIGLDKLENAIATPAKEWNWQDYPNLTSMPVFVNK